MSENNRYQLRTLKCCTLPAKFWYHFTLLCLNKISFHLPFPIYIIDEAMKSWQHKLHLAKLAAWMRAKATEQVDDLAQSFVMDDTKEEESDYHSNDYDIWPMGEEEKNPMEHTTTVSTQFSHSKIASFFIEANTSTNITNIYFECKNPKSIVTLISIALLF